MRTLKACQSCIKDHFLNSHHCIYPLTPLIVSAVDVLGRGNLMKAAKTVLILMCLNSPLLAAPPFSGTVFLDSDILTAEDPSSFVQVVAAGTGLREVFDRRVNNFVSIDARLFSAYYTDTEVVEIQVNPEFTASEAAAKAAFYGHVIGQLPLALRLDVQTVTLHKGDQAFGGGNNNILIHTEATDYHGEWLEETIFHEACHASLDSRVANTPDWINAQSTDPEFISTYARDNPNREDVAETCLMYFAARFRESRIATSTLATINETLANRLLVLDAHNINPVVSADRVSFYDVDSEQLTLTNVGVGGAFYEVMLSLADSGSLLFTADSASPTSAPNMTSVGEFSGTTLTVPLLLVAAQRYSIALVLHSENPVQFRLVSAVEVP